MSSSKIIVAVLPCSFTFYFPFVGVHTLHGVIAVRYGEDKKKPFSISKIQFISIKVVNSKLFGLYKKQKIFSLIAYIYVAAKSV